VVLEAEGLVLGQTVQHFLATQVLLIRVLVVAVQIMALLVLAVPV
jgi:hypothetical protein